MSGIKSLRTLVRLKTRRVEQREEALKEAKAQLQQAQDELEQARANEDSVRAAEQAVAQRLYSTTTNSSGFTAQDVVTLTLLLSDAEKATAHAAQQTRKAADGEARAKEHVGQCDTELKRSQHQLEGTQDRLKRALMEQERAQEDAQDEEAEETAVARSIARRKTVIRHREVDTSRGRVR
ncbi:MAG TPA: type III secretion protein [Burkholderiaceae bacterium]|nr:type III secretion protein [Burkholderiaceae bacterium]